VRFRDAVALAARGFSRRPGRAVLTVVAVALAAALLVALLTIARTAETRVLGQLSKGGPLAGIKVAAAAPDPTQLDRDDPRTGRARDIDDAAARRIAALRDVRSVVRVVGARAVVAVPASLRLTDGRTVHPVSRRADPAGVAFETVVGADLRFASSLPLDVIAGRLPSVRARTEIAVTPAHLALLGLKDSDAAGVVGTELEVGSPQLRETGGRDRFEVRWTRLQVVGVVAQEAADGELLVPIAQAQAARDWTLGGTDRGRRVGLDRSPYTGLFVVATGLDRVAPARAAITAVGYSTSAPENLIASVQRYLRVVEIVLSGIGAIALLIASLGITNALLAAVRERRREIGVMKAIGARDRDVLLVFLLEAAVLGFLGGLAGTGLGIAIAKTVGAVVNGYLTSQGLAGTRIGVSLPVIAGGVLGSAALATLAGVIPAWRAAHLSPREAVDA
jgi:uncharacterized protein YcfJ